MTNSANPLWSEDFAPTPVEKRSWNWLSFAALWVGMVVCVPSFMLASGMIAQGMSLGQAVFTVFLGNLIVLVPMVLIGMGGTKYGIPFPVLLRASFGVRGAILPALLRGLVACGWYGIQTWIGGQALKAMIEIVAGHPVTSDTVILGTDPLQFGCFIAFWLLQLYFVLKGTESLRWLETWCAPLLLLFGFALLGWAVHSVGLGALFDRPAKADLDFHTVFWPNLTAMVGFWATLALNMPDFTRFARSQKDQFIGQAIGLPVPMALFAFIGAAVAVASTVVYGEAIWDPSVLALKFGGPVAFIALVGVVIATLTTNLAANLVSPANDIAAIAPSRISFRMGGMITALIAILIMPWKLLETPNGYIFTWLIGYSSLLGPIAGIMLADYFGIRRQALDSDGLYREHGPYSYAKGWNPIAVLAFVVAVLPNAPGFLHAAGYVESVPGFFDAIYGYAWFTGALLAGALYMLLMDLSGKAKLSPGAAA